LLRTVSGSHTLSASRAILFDFRNKFVSFFDCDFFIFLDRWRWMYWKDKEAMINSEWQQFL
jgi:hypothetical protein